MAVREWLKGNFWEWWRVVNTQSGRPEAYVSLPSTWQILHPTDHPSTSSAIPTRIRPTAHTLLVHKPILSERQWKLCFYCTYIFLNLVERDKYLYYINLVQYNNTSSSLFTISFSTKEHGLPAEDCITSVERF